MSASSRPSDVTQSERRGFKLQRAQQETPPNSREVAVDLSQSTQTCCAVETSNIKIKGHGSETPTMLSVTVAAKEKQSRVQRHGLGRESFDPAVVVGSLLAFVLSRILMDGWAWQSRSYSQSLYILW